MGYQFFRERTDKEDIILQFPDPTTPSQVQFYYPHYNIEIPLMFQHYLKKRFYVITGISGILNVKNQIKEIKYFSNGTTTETNSTDNSTNYRKINMTVNLGFGFDYIKKENFSCFIQPFFQLAIMPISKTSSYSFNSLDYSSIGITTGFRF